VEPILGILDVKYLDESGTVVEAQNYTDLGTLGYTGGIWSNSTVNWPCMYHIQTLSPIPFSNYCDKTAKVFFDSIPPEFIEWVQRNTSIASQFPWLSECTNFVSKRPTGAPTVHIVVSTLTHKTSSIIATRPGNFGGAIPVPSSKTTSKTSVQVTPGASTLTTSSSATRPSTLTASAEQTSTAVTERISATSKVQDSTGTNTQHESSTTGEQGPSSVEQAPPTTNQHLPTGSEQASVPAVKQPTSAEQVTPSNTGQAPTTVPVEPTTVTGSPAMHPQLPGATEANNGPSSALSPTGVPTGGNNDSVPTTQPASLVTDTGSSPVALSVSTGNGQGPSSPYSDTNTVPNAAPLPAQTTTTLGSNGSTRLSSVLVISTNAQAFSSGDHTLPQQASQIIPPADASNNEPSGLSPTAITAPVLTLDSTTITPNPSNVYIISSQTLFPGGPAITIGSTAYSIATSTAVIIQPSQNPSLVPDISLSEAEPPKITLGSSVITANSDAGFVYASQTISAGGSGIVVEGSTYSIATSGSSVAIVENGVTSPVIIPSASGVQVTYSIPVVYIVASAVISGDSVQATISSPSIPLSTPLNVEDGGIPTASPVVKVSASALVTSGSPVVSVITKTMAPTIIIGSSTITQDSAAEFVIGSQTLAPGGPAITLQATTYSLASSASALIINDHTTPLSATPTTAILIAGKTLTPGVAVQVQGTIYSLASSGNAVVINGETEVLATRRVTSTVTPVSVLGTVSVGEGGVFTVGGRTYTVHTSATSGSVTKTLVVGGDGETASSSAIHAEGTGIGDAVASGLQIPTTTSSTSTLLDGSRVAGSGITATSTGSSGPGTQTSGASVATASTAGVDRAVQRDMWDIVGAAVIGGLIVF
jgi:hypothetical protein